MKYEIGPEEVIDGRWKVVERRGEGTFGALWVADDLKFLGRQVALKLLKPEFVDVPEIARRFDNEAHALGVLKHENIVEVLDRGKWRGVLYIVMEYVEGATLADHIVDAKETGSLPLVNVAAIFDQICCGVSVAHRLPDVGPIVHRDLKPENVMLACDAHGRMRVKVLDFGIAQLGTRRGTQSGVRVGTPLYMAPEQTLGEVARIGPQADVFTLALLLLEMLTGRQEYDLNTTWAAFVLRGGSTLDEIRRSRFDVPESVWGVIAASLDPEPERRPADAGVLRDMIAAAWPSEVAAELRGAAIFLRAPAGLARRRSGSGDGAFVRVESADLSLRATTLRRGGRRWGVVAALSTLGVVYAVALGRLLVAAHPTPLRSHTSRCPPGMVYLDPRVDGGAASVGLRPFCVDANEVTVAAFVASAEAGGRSVSTTVTSIHDLPLSPELVEAYERVNANCRGGDPRANAGHPMNCVSWADARAHCQSRQADLPSREQWQAALRGASNRRYPWGDQVATGAWFNACDPECVSMLRSAGPLFTSIQAGWSPGDSFPEAFSSDSDHSPTTALVGTFPRDRTSEGVRDLAGNVKEWTLNAPDSTEVASGDRPAVVLGGSCFFSKGDFDPARPIPILNSVRRVDLGFRCVHLPLAEARSGS